MLRFLGSERRRWWLLAGGWVLLLVLGIGGFVQQARDLDLSTTGLDHLSFTLQLAALEFEGASDALNWRLQVARFVGLPALRGPGLGHSHNSFYLTARASRGAGAPANRARHEL